MLRDILRAMMSIKLHFQSAAALLSLLLFTPACSCGGSTGTPTHCAGPEDCLATEVCLDSICTPRPGVDGGSDTGLGDSAMGDSMRPDSGDSGPECLVDTDCAGGACVSGACCTVADVCGSSCCGGGEECFANACVTPGATCVSTADCADGEYCESGLATGGGADGGVPDAGPRVCLGGGAGAGRCLALPPRCGAGEDGSDGHCIPVCEFHPTVGMLDATEQWHWGPDNVVDRMNATDVWSSPAVGRVYDTNCDGAVDINDPPNVVFVSGNARGTYCSNPAVFGAATACKAGSLRILDGRTGAELVSVRRPSADSAGFAGVSVALADMTGDGVMEIVAATGEGKVAILSGDGTVLDVSSQGIPDHTNQSFGWGGGLAVADMDGDGAPEIAYGHTLFTTMGGGITRLFDASGGRGGAPNSALSTFVDLDGDGVLELLGGQTAYRTDGSTLWDRSADLRQSAFPAVADLDGDGLPEVVLVINGRLLVLEGATGVTELGPLTLPGNGAGGPPTIADMDGDGQPEIGLAQKNLYTMIKPNYAASRLDVVWSTVNHDLSSSVTGSTVFDFEGDGIAEVIYNDECYLWVYDGPTGDVRFATPTLSFTATESSLVADIDGDGHAEMLMISNGANPSASGWKCNVAPWNNAAPDPAKPAGTPAWAPPPGASVYRGITVFRDSANSWVGTRALWNQHTYHVTNVCDARDTACTPAGSYGAIPTHERQNWSVPWLNNFRQNVQDGRLFDAPDATLSLRVDCTRPPLLRAALRNAGAAILPAGVVVGFYAREAGGDVRLGEAVSSGPLFPGQATELTLTATGRDASVDTFVAKVEVDPAAPTFRECHDDNNESAPVMARCLE